MTQYENTKDLAAGLIHYLRAELRNPAVAFASPLTELQGGYETSTYRFELSGVREKLSRPLVLRLYPRRYGANNAIRESAVQSVLARAGYPVADVHVVCPDMSVLGGAFFVMDWLPGRPLIDAPLEVIPAALGRLHAQLHNLDPEPLAKALGERGIPPQAYSLAAHDSRLGAVADRFPWLDQAARWLIENRPGEPEQKSICHGDFHPLNVLYADGDVTAILDWPGFAIADPAYDVACSMTLITIPSKHVIVLPDAASPVDWDLVAESYLRSYRTYRALDDTNLSYYRVRRCVFALAEGAEGQAIWQHPAIVRDLVAYIAEATGVRIVLPGNAQVSDV